LHQQERSFLAKAAEQHALWKALIASTNNERQRAKMQYKGPRSRGTKGLFG